MPSSNCCFLTYLQISQETGQVVWYSHLFKNFPQFIVIHIVKGFGVINKEKVDVFLELSCKLLIKVAKLLIASFSLEELGFSTFLPLVVIT